MSFVCFTVHVAAVDGIDGRRLKRAALHVQSQERIISDSWTINALN